MSLKVGAHSHAAMSANAAVVLVEFEFLAWLFRGGRDSGSLAAFRRLGRRERLPFLLLLDDLHLEKQR